MNKKLSALFDLPEPDDQLNEEILEQKQVDIVTQDTYSTLEKIENALPQIRGLDASDIEMDSLATMATDSYKDLLDLGMQVDSRFASEIFNSAGTMLGHAITAKTAKINKKLKMLDLQLKKAALDHKIAGTEKEIESTPIGEGQLLDRNELLKSLLNNKKTQ